MTNDGPVPESTPYELFGGEEFFERLVDGFYDRVEKDPVLRPMYPPGDLTPARRRLRMFLEQYWGGPGTYSEERGHPRLRMRHAGFHVNAEARDRWLAAMYESIADIGMPPEAERMLWQYLVGAAIAMQNVEDDAPPPGSIDVTEVSGE